MSMSNISSLSYFKSINPSLGIHPITNNVLFYLKEFFVSKDYNKLANNMHVTDNDIKHFSFMCQAVLLPIRLYVNKPMIILSGKRSEELNNAIGGSINSDHLYSCACDFTVKGIDNLNLVYDWIIKYSPYYRQIIWYHKHNFIHISINSPYNPNKPKHEYLIK